MTFGEFLEEPHLRNAWISADGGNLSAYVRKFKRYFPEGETTIDIASLNAETQGTGSLTRFLDEVDTVYSVFIENVFDLRLQEFFVRRGYTLDPTHSMALDVGVSINCYYKIVSPDIDEPVAFGFLSAEQQEEIRCVAAESGD